MTRSGLDQQQSTRIQSWLVEETECQPWQVVQTIALFDQGATVPFIARYRKEQTGELDEVAIRLIEDRLGYFRELEERKSTVLAAIGESGKLTPELAARIAGCRQKTELEDLYLPFRPKRRTKAAIARERGLEALADLMAAQELTTGTPEEAAADFVDPEREVADAASALAGAGHILAERLAEDADARAAVRRLTWEQGVLSARVAPDQVGTVSKFEMYYDYREPLKAVPSHRMLAMRRGEKEGVLRLAIEAPEADILLGLKARILKHPSIFGALLAAVAEDAWRRLLYPTIEVELRLEAKNRADAAAIEIFAGNLHNLLLSPPAGSRRVLGIDPGLRTGSKLAAVDGTGRFLAHATIYPHTGEARVPQARRELLRLMEECAVEMVAVGNGTAGREMEQFVRETLAAADRELPVVTVSEAGASVYSASEIAREEFPELDLTVRGAISIARRLQDPLAELVKVDPKSIGVGQYQHDVSQPALKKSLDATVESCVNYVGVDLNTASWALLSFVAGIGESLARAVIRHRDAHGPFSSRQALLAVPRFGAKAFEQAAGFLRIRGGTQPLDNTAVHPENYPLVERMADDLGVSLTVLTSQPDLAGQIDLKRYVSATVGLPTLHDIVEELKKPGRDPRQKFVAVAFREDVREMTDLQAGMILPGTVTNVTAFGAFVDVGVHQDGLVHISHLAQRFVKDPHQVVKVGDAVRVKVLAVDLPRKRIALSIKEADHPGPRGSAKAAPPETSRPTVVDPATAFAQAGYRVKKASPGKKR